MVLEVEQKPRVIEIQIQIDCNGCVQKIKKALHDINGIHDINIDVPQQKVTITGWADPEKIIKAIKKTRKTATICSNTEIIEATTSNPLDQIPEISQPASNAVKPLSYEPDTSAEPATPAIESTEQQKSQEKPTEEEKSRPPTIKSEAAEPPDFTRAKDGLTHSYDGHENRYTRGQQDYLQEPSNRLDFGQGFMYYRRQPSYVTHSHGSYKPSPYVTEYECINSPPRNTNYSMIDNNIEDYRNNNYNNGNANIAAIFSDENPNACRIM